MERSSTQVRFTVVLRGSVRREVYGGVHAISITLSWQMALRDARIFNSQTRWSKKMDTARRRLLAGIGGLSLGAAVSAVQPRQANASETSSVAGSEGGEDSLAVA